MEHKTLNNGRADHSCDCKKLRDHSTLWSSKADRKGFAILAIRRSFKRHIFHRLRQGPPIRRHRIRVLLLLAGERLHDLCEKCSLSVVQHHAQLVPQASPTSGLALSVQKR